ncbi:MAG: EI24 domain-containing protein [Synechococcales bacterium]|nr:EI24 domain-containing protein [Synechococcales bacterium]
MNLIVLTYLFIHSTETPSMTPEPPQLPEKNTPILRPVRRGPGSLLTGATYPFRALWLFVKQPRYRSYVLIPIAINLILGITLYAGLLTLGFRLLDWLVADVETLVAHPPQVALPSLSTEALSWPQWQISWPQWHLPHWQINWPQWHLPQWHFTTPDWFSRWSAQLADWFSRLPRVNLRFPDWIDQVPTWFAAGFLWLVRLVLTLVLLLITGFIFLQFGVLLGSPWYGKLSEEIERGRTGQVVTVEVGLVQDIWRAIAYELKKLVISLGIGIPLLLLSFVIGPGTLVGTIGGITVAATLSCMDFFDGMMERRRLKFRQKLGMVWRALPASASFGLICLGLVSIPFINLLAIPICVTAGTLFVCDRLLPDLPQLPGDRPQ